MGAGVDLELCRCGGPRVHHRKSGSATALCGLTVTLDSIDYTGPRCVNCSRRVREIQSFAPLPPATRFQLASIAHGDRVHLVEMRPGSPQWTARQTLCGRDVEALIAYHCDVTCRRCVAAMVGGAKAS